MALTEVWGGRATRLENRLDELTDPGPILRCIEIALLKGLPNGTEPRDRLLREAVASLSTGYGGSVRSPGGCRSANATCATPSPIRSVSHPNASPASNASARCRPRRAQHRGRNSPYDSRRHVR
ncbi:hypothetical protein V2E29_33115 [Streptomyces diastatochromogenes]|uniref:hypothetical protein n=1 Tax=Streptomyces diastatochromogenes TaxID=42236 RepID=UPI002F267048